MLSRIRGISGAQRDRGTAVRTTPAPARMAAQAAEASRMAPLYRRLPPASPT